MDFVALDVETANADLASICQIGMAVFQEGQERDSWETLVDPEDFFDGMNVSIHGIDEAMVAGAPKFPELFDAVREKLVGRIVVSHMPFDRLALERATEKYGLPHLDCTWLDSAKVVRRAWKQFAREGYGLSKIARWCGIEFEHHRALEDARVAGKILLRAINDTGLSVDDWLQRIKQPIDPVSSSKNIDRVGNPDGPLAGEVMVFTGALSMSRREAADLAARVGCDVASGVNKRTTLLVVGDQDVKKLGGHVKSSKHRKAEALIAQGQEIRILGESDFRRLVDTT